MLKINGLSMTGWRMTCSLTVLLIPCRFAMVAVWPEVWSLRVKASSVFRARVWEPWLLCGLHNCHVPEQGTDGMKETLLCGERPKAPTQGLKGWHRGGTNSIFTPLESNYVTTQGFFSSSIIVFCLTFSATDIQTKEKYQITVWKEYVKHHCLTGWIFPAYYSLAVPAVKTCNQLLRSLCPLINEHSAQQKEGMKCLMRCRSMYNSNAHLLQNM